MKDSVQTFLWIALIFLSTVFFTITLVDYENEIESLELELETRTDSLNCTIDSLKSEIDTLTWENEIWDFNTEHETNHLLSALMFVESGFDDSAYVASEDAVGVLQIRKTMVDDVNRILKRQKKDYRFTYNDRWSRNKSIQMFDIYVMHYGLSTAEEVARCWNGGPRGMNKDATVYYWNKVQDYLDS